MRPRRKAAVRAAEAVTRPLSPSPLLSDEEEEDFAGLDDMENEIFSDEQDEIEDDDETQDQLLDDNMDSLSEQEQELEDDNLDELQEDDDDEEEEEPIVRKSTARNNKRKKPVIESEDEEGGEGEEEEALSDDAEVVRNKPMTKRQRAKVFHDVPEEYLELPMDTGKKKHLTEEEEQLKKSEVARRRKNQSIQRAEKDKADTINRLLKKQASKTKRVVDETEDAGKLKRLQDPNRLHYTNTSQGSQLSIPSVYSIQQIFGQHSTMNPIGELKKCQIQGCLNNRKYTVAKSGKYVCSLEHYKLAL